MSRRDIIIIAVLINAGLLIVLFASALKSSSTQDEMSQLAASLPAKEAELSLRKEVASTGDEVDQVLREFSKIAAAPAVTTSAMPSEAVKDAQVGKVVEMPEAKTNFAEDLQALTSSSPAPLPPALVAKAAPEAVQKSSAEIEVKVKKGDVLEKIARTHHTSVEEIMKLNSLRSTNLKIGQVLKIPQKSKKNLAASSATSTPKYYTVKNGDNPWTIAVKNHMKVEELLKLNNMDAEKAKHLKPGDQLRIQ